MLSLKVLSIELSGEDDTCAAYCLRVSKGSGLHEYSTTTKPKDKSKRRAEFDDAVDILYGEQEADPLLVVSLLGAWEDKSQQVISVQYLSIPQLLKKQVLGPHRRNTSSSSSEDKRATSQGSRSPLTTACSGASSAPSKCATPRCSAKTSAT